ncbi:LOG family protein [Crenalkalicoccus roseus]|uniref:LOG family protein n=1 Tax=Crenalkalicoccus roseus TaxID=1485588 RepID=UPI0010815D28|nr:LOG family protein [Crenalkalicoccus roseus]
MAEPLAAPGPLAEAAAAEGNHAQTGSPSYRLAIEDADFLRRDEMRALRFAMEYGKAELALRDWGVRSTVVVFGSARIPAPEAAEAFVAAAPPERRARAEALARLSPWYEKARAFARLVSLRGGALASGGKPRDNVIATGGGPGIMEAANRGAADVGAPSIGFNISLPHEQAPNRWSTPELTFRFHYFAMRKMHLAMRANALAVFPGGFGTLDELFEILTLLQTGKAPPVAVVLFGRAWWSGVIGWRMLAEHGMVEPRDLDLFAMVDEPEEAWEALLARGLKAHTPPGEAPER